MRRIFFVVLIVLLSACSSGNGADAPTTEPEAAGTAAEGGGEGTPVSIVELAFNPAEVSVAAGETVTWTNGDTVPHTVTFEEGESSDRLSEGDAFSRTFDTAGEFAYVCSIHPQMSGTVTVTG